MDQSPDPTFHPDPDPTPSLTHAGKAKKKITFYSYDSLHCFIFLVSVTDLGNFLGKRLVFLYIWLKGIQIRIRLRIGSPADADPDPNPAK